MPRSPTGRPSRTIGELYSNAGNVLYAFEPHVIRVILELDVSDLLMFLRVEPYCACSRFWSATQKRRHHTGSEVYPFEGEGISHEDAKKRLGPWLE